MKVLIADDEPLARALLRTLLLDLGDVELVGEARDAAEAVALADRLRPDAVFLDVEMGGGHGITTAHELQSRAVAEVVFVTAHEQHAVDAFDLGAADYVLKPVRRPRLAKALDRVRARLREKRPEATPDKAVRAAEPEFWVRTMQGKVRLQASEIFWVEAARDHVFFHASDGSYLYRTTMEELEEKFRDTPIVRVQRSAFVRLDKVAAVVRRRKIVLLQLANFSEVAVGPNYEASTLRALSLLQLGRANGQRPRGRQPAGRRGAPSA